MLALFPYRPLPVKPKELAEAAKSVAMQCKSPIERMYFGKLHTYILYRFDKNLPKSKY